MSALVYLGVAAAGFAVGAINTIAGAGSLLSFPILLAAGLSPLAANVTNTLGLLPGAGTGAYAQRDELVGQRASMLTLAWPVAVGSVVGAILLLTLPGAVFNQVIPLLVAAACLLVAVQPAIAARSVRRGRAPVSRRRSTSLIVFALGIYGGYFGAAFGIVLIGLLGLMLPEKLRRTNARKTVLQGVTNAPAAVIFTVFAPVHWVFALTLAISSSLGGPVGARLARLIPAGPLRTLIVVIGLGVALHLGLDAY